MKKFLTLLVAVAAVSVMMAQNSSNPFAGRWNLSVQGAPVAYPGWLEVTEKGGQTQVRVQPRTGSVRPASDVKLQGNRLDLQVSPEADGRPAVRWELSVSAGKITGMQKRGSEKPEPITGVRAPALNRPMPSAWTDPQPIFNGKDLTGWQPDDASTNHWTAKNGELVNQAKGANLRTTRKFDDFKLHIELNCPDAGNSGIYLRGRYEVQVEYEPVGVNDPFHSMGAIYGFLAPSTALPKKPGQWESLDVTLVGRRLTIVRNGVTTIDNQEIPGTTGGAIDGNEAEPGPFYIQGDHTGGMKYRNITVSVPK